MIAFVHWLTGVRVNRRPILGCDLHLITATAGSRVYQFAVADDTEDDIVFTLAWQALEGQQQHE